MVDFNDRRNGGTHWGVWTPAKVRALGDAEIGSESKSRVTVHYSGGMQPHPEAEGVWVKGEPSTRTGYFGVGEDNKPVLLHNARSTSGTDFNRVDGQGKPLLITKVTSSRKTRSGDYSEHYSRGADAQKIQDASGRSATAAFNWIEGGKYERH